MPNVNDIETNYGRVYRYIKPNSSEPGTWRLSVPETGIGSGGVVAEAQEQRMTLMLLTQFK